jgi:integrase
LSILAKDVETIGFCEAHFTAAAETAPYAGRSNVGILSAEFSKPVTWPAAWEAPDGADTQGARPMPVVTFHPRRIASLARDPLRQIDYYDQSLMGFGLRVSPGGSRTWFVILRVGRIVRRFKLGTFPSTSLARARREAKANKAEATLGKDPGKERYKRRRAMTFVELVERYVRSIRGQIDTWEAVQRVLERDVIPRFRAYLADEVEKIEIVELLEELDARAPSAARKALEAIRQVYSFAMKRGIVKENPAAGLEPPTRKKKRQRFLTMDEIVKIMRELPRAAFLVAAALILLLLSSARLDEILSLRKPSIDLKAGHLVLLDTKSDGRPHAVPLTPLMVKLIEKLLSLNPDDPDGFLFPSSVKQTVHLSGSHLRRKLKEILERAGVDPTWLHDLRRSGATHFGRLGIPQKVIEKQLNHTGSTVTDIYNLWDFWPERCEAMRKWEAELLSYPVIRRAVKAVLAMEI